MTIVIRAARADDWEAMQDVFVRTGQAAWCHTLDPASLAELSAPDRWDPRSGAEVFVAECAGNVAGFVCIRASADEDASPTIGEIDGFYVLPTMWSQGVGQALLAAGLDRLAASGFKEATVWTEHRNHRPLQFYRAGGWNPDGRERRRTYRGNELLEIRLRLTVAGRT